MKKTNRIAFSTNFLPSFGYKFVNISSEEKKNISVSETEISFLLKKEETEEKKASFTQPYIQEEDRVMM